MDKHLPSRSSWHTDLLDQMVEHREKRPPVLSQSNAKKLKQLLKFRHRVNNIYRYELIYEEAEKHAKTVVKLHESVSEELDVFITFLNDT